MPFETLFQSHRMDYKTFLGKVGKTAELDADTCGDLTEVLTELMEEALASGDTVCVPTFGNFEPRKRNERIMSHPSSPGRRLLVPPKLVASFKPSTILKNRVNNGGSE